MNTLLQKAAESLIFLKAYENSAHIQEAHENNFKGPIITEIQEDATNPNSSNMYDSNKTVDRFLKFNNMSLPAPNANNILQTAINNYSIWKAIVFPSLMTFVIMTEKYTAIWIKIVLFSLFVGHIIFIGGFQTLPQVYKTEI